jgi:hypothetical protein
MSDVAENIVRSSRLPIVCAGKFVNESQPIRNLNY